VYTVRVQQVPHRRAQPGQRFTIDRVIDPPGVVRVPFALHQTDLEQRVYVVRDQAERQPQLLGDLAIALDALHQHVEHTESRGLTKRLEHLRQLLVRNGFRICGNELTRKRSMVQHALNYIPRVPFVKLGFWPPDRPSWNRLAWGTIKV
jgi:hypothetical protein